MDRYDRTVVWLACVCLLVAACWWLLVAAVILLAVVAVDFLGG